ncbi:peptidoglycan DD-metalloendopeptidase family protein [Mucilaginibacter mali]|uniref:Peptidoglycan DD-metalloendopeptidase family protein n=1 Tax=Mucilaginibacter mali TaxID=2740462 RepID=A0A7D4Q312_9SPHI|nr:peptidoglycan DD-metalloendopeptidase family protein [Mucilaginibacter mali]QKJ31826.1 peptidoglycan DD-metalloendopeptidase family protein [Mucilaginibacter mali]
MDKHRHLSKYILSHPEATGKVVDYNPAADKLYTFDFTATNTELSPDDVADTAKFSAWVDAKLAGENYKYGIGGYMEHRTLYARSALFDTAEEPRRLHLGVDIWAKAGTPVYAPFAGTVHSFNDNNNFGDYGPTIILEHDLNGLTLYSLYGHLNRESLAGLYPGKPIALNQQIGAFGEANENGSWPPHLHFQLMFDMEGKAGDYPGVGRYSEMEKLMMNIPDPALVLGFSYG